MDDKTINNKRILIISFSKVAQDPRVMRQIEMLKRSYRINVIGFGENLDEQNIIFNTYNKNNSLIEKSAKALLIMFREFEKAYWNSGYIKNALSIIKDKVEFDIVIANEIDALPLSLKVAEGKPVLFDAHEFYPGQFTDRYINKTFIIPLNKYLCNTYIPKVSAMTTVSQGLGDEYQRLYNVNIEIVTNAPFYHKLKPKRLQDGSIRIIHHGKANSSRKIESMIRLSDYLDDRFIIDLMLIPGSISYYKKLKKMIEKKPRVNLIKPVNMNCIVEKLNSYDIGLFILEPTSFNYKHALPNKLFEYIQGRVGIAIGPSVEMAKLVDEYNLGIVADSFEPIDMAKKLNILTAEEIFEFKNASDLAAIELCAENNARIFEKLVSDLINNVK